LNGIEIPEKTFTNHAEAAAKYPGRSMLRYVHSHARRASLVRWR
jgi:hypothetical protein